VNARLNAGYQQVVWDGKNAFGTQVASGMYLYRITAGDFVSTKKMMMLK
jgi:flagellar hook assembly protein FlgD